jgi:CheY-like chemotaxis protein
MRNIKPILLVEDDRVDAMTTERAFREIGVKNELVRKVDGEGAMDYLKDERTSKPCIILLDLNMPKMNGIELMRLLKADDELKMIPVVVLTTSKQEEDRDESFKLGTAGYMIKRTDYDEFLQMIEAINRYWTFSELPNGE